MKRAVFCMAAILATLPAVPQARQDLSTAERSVVEGIVLSGNTEHPLERAHVTLRSVDNPNRAYAVVTGTDGRFVLRDLDSGRYRLSATRAGYVLQEYGQRGSGQPGSVLVLAPGQQVNEITFHMIATAVIAGRVVDATGEPLPGVQVQALRRNFQPGQSRLIAVSSGATDDRGGYRIWGLQPGRYFIGAISSVAVEPSGMMISVPKAIADSDQAKGEPYVRTYYPGTSEFSEAASIEVGPGEERTSADFTMRTARMLRVRGRVVNSVNPRGTYGIPVQLKSKTEQTGFPLVYSTNTDDDRGSFEMRGVAPGSYILTALWFEGRRQYAARQAIELSNSDMDRVSLVITPGINLSGHIRSDRGAQVNPAALRIDLRSRDGLTVVSGNSVAVKTDGSFSLENIPEGVFDVYIDGCPEGVYLKSARYGTQETLDSGLIIRQGQPLGSLEVELARSSAQIDGLVTDDEKTPVSGAQVVMVPDGDRRARTDFYRTVTTDQAGRFHLADVPPGGYQLFAWDNIESGAYLDPEFRQSFESRAQQLATQDLGHYDAELTLISVPKD